MPVGRMDERDLVVSIGGDGTSLFATRDTGTTPMLGVTPAEVDFLNAVPPEEPVDTVRGVDSEIPDRAPRGV